MTTTPAENKTENIQITLLGSCGVGKTCITNRFIKNEFKETRSTPGANYQQKIITRGDKIVQLDIWDTAGQDRFNSLRFYYKDAYIIIFVYDITHKGTFEDIKTNWFDGVKKYGEKYSVLAIVGNKSDLYENEDVDESMARAYAEEIGATFMLVSAQNGSNIDYLFDTVVELYFENDFQPKAQEMIKGKQERAGSIKLGKDVKTHKKKNFNCK